MRTPLSSDDDDDANVNLTLTTGPQKWGQDQMTPAGGGHACTPYNHFMHQIQ